MQARICTNIVQPNSFRNGGKRPLRSNAHSLTQPPFLRAPHGEQESDTPATPDLGAEKHYSVAELARLWSLSEKTIRRMFEKEPGVLQWGKLESRSRRAYTTLRIPESVALRVHRRLRIAG